MTRELTTLDTARSCTRQGWLVVPIPSGEKGPQIHGWQNLRITEAQLPKYFNNGSNIGILLGEPSDGLVDVDMDVPEAITIGEVLLPETSMVHGRPGKPFSHRWYRVTPPDISTRQ